MKRAFVLMAISGLNIIALFVYQWYVVVRLGAGAESDAVFASMVLPQVILNVVSGSLSYVLVPILATVEGDEFATNVSNCLGALGALFGIIGILLYLTVHLWVPLTVPGFSPSGKALTESLARIQILGMFFTGWGAVGTAAYQARHQFVYSAAATMAASVLALVFLVVALPRIGVSAAAWGLSLRALLQFAFQIPGVLPVRWPNWRDERFRLVLAKLRPLILGTSYYKTDQLVDRLLISLAPAGELSLLHLSQQMYAAANQVLVIAIASPAVPVLAAQASRQEWQAFERKMMRTLGILMVLGAAIYALIAFPGYYVLLFVFGHGKLAHSEIRLLWLIMLAYVGFWMTGLSGQILSTSFFAMHDTKTPTTIGVVGFTIGVALKIGGFLLYGVWGIAIGTGAYMTLNSVAMYWILRKRLRVAMPVACPDGSLS
ncbi:lipid II flippase MurJ [Trinickia dinghuensis]|uniref:Virulence factor MviN n=1 Tax=Trinickia dinghuensis TaxID=2291023 RepID=A0A3D8JTY4_9BURK|nr:lipid II flippase MurJ [Trinickia dinghuensis]RDU96034.1 virulence factor MviN [Trinickia dinghuensis]